MSAVWRHADSSDPTGVRTAPIAAQQRRGLMKWIDVCRSTYTWACSLVPEQGGCHCRWRWHRWCCFRCCCCGSCCGSWQQHISRYLDSAGADACLHAAAFQQDII